ncbi:amidohydrolase family protein [Oxyplasma meridianum]|uniref:Amidohydrolase family protein n=1 Tax=Oxyplasma meridianum TaxID=3073602 RepID=A0AAX4NHE6_9ARCH
MQSTLIRDAIIVTQNSKREVRRGNILIKGNIISQVGETSHDADMTIDAGKNIILPGFINTHCHVAMSHLKNRLDDVPLQKFLDMTFKLDSGRTAEGLYNSSMLGISEMINNGITSFADLYYSEDIIARAVMDSGIRGYLSWVTLDRKYTTQEGDTVDNAEKFIKEFTGKDRITPSVGIQGIYVAGDDIYSSVSELAKRHGTIIHTHLAETREEVYNFVKTHNGKRPIEHLSDIGFLTENVLAAHTVWATLREVKLIAKAGTKVSWNSVSNFKLGVGGVPPIPEMMTNGVTISMGTDSNGSNNSLNMLEAMKFSALSVKNERWNPSLLKAQEILDMATVNGARSLGDETIGSIETGKKADIIMVDSTMPNIFPVTEENAVNSIVYSANPSNIKMVMVDGKILKGVGKDFPVDGRTMKDKIFT